MKTKALLFGLIFSSIGLARAQSISNAAPAQATAPALQVTERGANHRVWSTVTWTTNRAGVAMAHTNAAYTELATGMHHLVNGQWIESSDAVEITATGGQVTNCQYGVSFLGNINSTGAVDVALPEGNHLTSSILGLSYFDTSTGDSVMIGQVTNSDGQILPSGNRVLYPNAFSGISADVLYANSIHGLEQFVILHEQPPSPSVYGLNPSTTMLEVITEFFNAPTPSIINRPVGPLMDHELCFGAMRMSAGAAFALGSETNKVRVTKQWLLMNGRRCLVEQVLLSSIQSQLQELPVYLGSASLRGSPGSFIHHLAGQRPLPDRKLAVGGKSTGLKTAATSPKSTGFVMDYDLLSSQTNFTFQGDTTYYVSGSINLHGTTTIEGGTVVKFTNFATITFFDTVACKTSSYRPAVFTAKDDDSIGNVIAGSTGSPSGYYGDPRALVLFEPCTLSNLRFSRMDAISLENQGAYSFRDVQFLNCGVAMEVTVGPVIINLYNGLFYNTGSCFYYPITSEGPNLTCQNSTIHNCGTFTEGQDGYSLEDDYDVFFVSIVNSLFAGTGLSARASTNYTAVLATDTGIFQTVGGADHYLAAGSPYRNVGTTDIDADLLADIAQKTTYPPIVYSNVTIATNITLGPQAQRDTDTPDLGYHYDPLDYVFDELRITNAAANIEPGTAIGTCGPYGIAVWAGATLISQGIPTNLNHITRYNMVQECSNTNWVGDGNILDGDWKGGSPAPQVAFRFVDLSQPAADGGLYNSQNAGTIFSATDCQFRGGLINVTAYNPSFTNCLFERVNSYVGDGSYGPYPVFRNCLFFGGSLYLDDLNETTYTLRDNLFDQTVITESDDTAIDGAYDAYTSVINRLTPTNSHDVVASIVYQSGPLGNYYQATNSLLINAGSTTADLVGLYHYTTQTNQIKETNSVVDVGFHYVAVDTNGVPMDSDGDGLADYLEDINGDGIYQSSIDLSDWQNPDTSGDGMLDGWKYLWGLSMRTNNVLQTGQRANYTYDPVGWLDQITGLRGETINPDAEGNILSDSE